MNNFVKIKVWESTFDNSLTRVGRRLVERIINVKSIMELYDYQRYVDSDFEYCVRTTDTTFRITKEQYNELATILLGDTDDLSTI